MMSVVAFVIVSVSYFRVAFFFFKQKTAYEMRISDWSSDVCSSDLRSGAALSAGRRADRLRRYSRRQPNFADAHDGDAGHEGRGRTARRRAAPPHWRRRRRTHDAAREADQAAEHGGLGNFAGRLWGEFKPFPSFRSCRATARHPQEARALTVSRLTSYRTGSHRNSVMQGRRG